MTRIRIIALTFALLLILAFPGLAEDTTLILPAELMEIGAQAFMDDTSFTDIVIPSGVTAIGERAFRGSGLISIALPASLQSLGSDVLYLSERLQNITVDPGNEIYSDIDGVLYDKAGTKLLIFPNGREGVYTIPDGVTTIGDSALAGSTLLTSVVIPDSVTSIENFAFVRCDSLESVVIPDSVTAIGNHTFWYCASLTSVTIPESVTSIYPNAFDGCPNVTIKGYAGSTAETFANEHDIPFEDIVPAVIIAKGTCDNLRWTLDNKGLLTISGEGLIYDQELHDYDIYVPHYSWWRYRDSIKKVKIEEGATGIGEEAFSECTGLTSVTIPASVTEIRYYSFGGCSSLPSITIPDGVTFIDPKAFSGCSSLTKFVVSSGNTTYKSYDGILYDNQKTSLILCPKGKTGAITVPSGVTSIGEYAFSDCSGLTNITIPSGVTSIGEYVFSYCRGLTSVTIPEGVTSIGSSAFYNCKGLTSVTIPASVTSIAEDAFSGCTGLIICGYEGTAAQDYAESYGIPFFNPTEEYTQGTCGDNLTWILDSDGLLTIRGKGDMADADHYPWSDQAERIQSVLIRDNVTSIGSYAFSGCGNLANVTIPFGLESIGANAFNNCSHLTDVYITVTVTSIGADAFGGCGDLTISGYSDSTA